MWPNSWLDCSDVSRRRKIPESPDTSTLPALATLNLDTPGTRLHSRYLIRCPRGLIRHSRHSFHVIGKHKSRETQSRRDLLPNRRGKDEATEVCSASFFTSLDASNRERHNGHPLFGTSDMSDIHSDTRLTPRTLNSRHSLQIRAFRRAKIARDTARCLYSPTDHTTFRHCLEILGYSIRFFRPISPPTHSTLPILDSTFPTLNSMSWALSFQIKSSLNR